MEGDWKDYAKKFGALALLVAFLAWLFTPADPRFNKK